MLVRNRHRQINHRQQHEDISLNERNKEMQRQGKTGSANGMKEKAISVSRSLASMLA